jgi:aminoglycoside 3-N-acetyltransferase
VNYAASKTRLSADLVALGLRPGATVLVHSSMRAFRPLRVEAVVGALLDVIGADGTLMVPTQTAWNSTSSPGFRRATAGLTERQIAEYRAGLPAFDRLTTPSAGMGILAEYVRTLPGAARSSHPQTSFAAVGARARDLTSVHDLDCHLGPRSPIGALCDAGGVVLHLGTGFGVSTVFHLAEYLYRDLPTRDYECRVERGWISFPDIPLDDSDFIRLGEDFEHASVLVTRGAIGPAQALLFPARDAVEYAVDWMRRERGAGGAESAASVPLPQG